MLWTMDKVQKIREEVERLMNELIQEKEKGFGSDTDDACILELQNVLTYIDSLQEEHASEELEEAAKDHSNNLDNIYGSIGEQTRNAFKAGANWQKEQDEETLKDRIINAYNRGMKQMEQQIMKDSLDVEVKIDAGGYPYIDKTIELYDYNKDVPLAKAGEKVKVIVIKRD